MMGEVEMKRSLVVRYPPEALDNQSLVRSGLIGVKPWWGLRWHLSDQIGLV
jgi:hypothetical protein